MLSLLVEDEMNIVCICQSQKLCSFWTQMSQMISPKLTLYLSVVCFKYYDFNSVS